MKPELSDLPELWARYQPLVSSEINSCLTRYGHDYHVEREDLEAVALETLWRCIERFEPARQVRTPRNPEALFLGFYKGALYNNLSQYCRKWIPHFYLGHGSKARWHHVRTTSFDQLTEDQQDRQLPPEAA